MERKRPSLVGGDLLPPGTTMPDLLTVEPSPQIPSLVNKCLKHLETNGMHTLGIFRVSSSKKRVRQVSKNTHIKVLSKLTYTVPVSIYMHIIYCITSISLEVVKEPYIQDSFSLLKKKKKLNLPSYLQLREEFDTGQEVWLNEECCPHDVATLLKEFFRDLPEPLLTRELYEPLIKTQSKA